MSRHHSNHKDKIADCFICSQEELVDKAKKRIKKATIARRKERKEAAKYAWSSKKRYPAPRFS